MVEQANEISEAPTAPQTLAAGAPPEQQQKEETKSSQSGFKMPQTPKETLQVCKLLKDEGNIMFKQKDYQKAISKYSRIMMFSKTIMAEEQGDHMLSMV